MKETIFVCSNNHFLESYPEDGECQCGCYVYRYNIEPKTTPSSLLTTPIARLASTTVTPRLLSILDKKQHDYGPSNIARHGQLGVVIRIDDKTSRLANLLSKKTNPVNESILDSWDDIANYGIIGGLVARGQWPDK